MISLEQLQHAVKTRIQRYNEFDFPVADRVVQSVALLDSQQHILAQDIVSPFAVPRNNLSAMDGYALAMVRAYVFLLVRLFRMLVIQSSCKKTPTF